MGELPQPVAGYEIARADDFRHTQASYVGYVKNRQPVLFHSHPGQMGEHEHPKTIILSLAPKSSFTTLACMIIHVVYIIIYLNHALLPIIGLLLPIIGLIMLTGVLFVFYKPIVFTSIQVLFFHLTFSLGIIFTPTIILFNITILEIPLIRHYPGGITMASS